MKTKAGLAILIRDTLFEITKEEVRFPPLRDFETDSIRVSTAIRALAGHISLEDVEIIEHLRSLAQQKCSPISNAAIKALGEVGVGGRW